MPLGISTTFRAKPMLTAPPQGALERSRQMLMPADEMSSESGALYAEIDQADFTGHYSFEWLFDTRANIKAFQAFFDARKGRYEPFWFPTWQFPFHVVEQGANDIINRRIWFQPQGYGASIFPLGTVHRHVIAVRGPLFWAIQVSAVGSDAAGEWVRETGGQTIGDPYTSVIGTFLTNSYSHEKRLFLSYIYYGRFAADALEIEYLTNDLARVRATILHLPDETP